jgi:SAM-dependent methyltransferase
MVSKLKQIAKKTKSGIIAAKIYDDWQLKRRFKSGNFESLHGATHSRIIKNTSGSVDYINAQFNDYLQYSGLKLEQLEGMRIFELGFGDNVGVALKLIVAGASKVVCLDKFYSKRDEEHQIEIYRALRETLTAAEHPAFDEAISLNNGIKLNGEKIECIYGVDVENAAQLKNSQPFDLVISRGAIQDIYDPDAAFEAMDRILKPGGLMLHKIDLSDQGIFRDNGMNPLTFLTISESVYRLMAINSGKPNRKLISYYRHVIERLGYEAKLLITDIIGVGDVGKGDLHPHKPAIELGVDYSESSLDLVREIRPRLIPEFRKLPDLELLIDGIFLIAKKPA